MPGSQGGRRDKKLSSHRACKVRKGAWPETQFRGDGPSGRRDYDLEGAGRAVGCRAEVRKGRAGIPGTAGFQEGRASRSVSSGLQDEIYPLSASPELGSAAGAAGVPSPAGAAAAAAAGFVSTSSVAVALAVAAGPGAAPTPAPGPVPAAAITATSWTSRENSPRSRAICRLGL